ncbi:MAG: UDP-N-acetylmuramoyl-tripeptide--D-alanyl-D-alanine ligase [Lentisphaeria bacterium]|nr:UDP-N-acetylmuramoyl-tripeptide--D-alanyl-D-alanine ligase [Lentisphaeria bacterium]
MSVCFTIDEIASVCGGKWLSEATAKQVEGINDDSRSIVKGNLFVALKGELADGHKYVLNAARAGAACLLAERAPTDAELSEIKQLGCGCLLVEDSCLAYHKLANAYRRRFPKLPIVGVTGSCGKTSTKEMVAAVLEKKFPGHVVKTVGNTNNFFGVPRNLFRINHETQAAVIEMGSNKQGEIDRLASMVEPTAGIVCNIGAAHLEFFHDLRGVAEEKGDLFLHTPENATVVMPGEAVGLDILKRHAGGRRILTFGACADCDVKGEYLGLRDGGYGLKIIEKKSGRSVEFKWGLGGAHQAVNAAGAAAIGLSFGMSLEEIADGLKACELPGARMKVENINGRHWVNDSYNANPDSMRASLSWFKEISASGKNRVLILGDMLELGENSANAHDELLKWVRKEFPEDRLVTVGKLMAPTSELLGLEHYMTSDDAKAALAGTFAEDAWILLKGSNSIGLGKIL